MSYWAKSKSPSDEGNALEKGKKGWTLLISRRRDPSRYQPGRAPMARRVKNAEAYTVTFPPLNRAWGRFAFRAQPPCRDLESRRVPLLG
ncbi:hypothetical protein Taro_021746 [Colocasia esculenta]|uniref:Uncharacterized protein n=1 Tax=Colocasia esculenta TaxID=4460 RepID=A0A843V950_COLES|nr:hypothetical protein [Colocasia esculenta]